MKKYKKHILKILCAIFFFLIFLLIGIVTYEFQKAERLFVAKTPELLEESVTLNIKPMVKDIYYASEYKYNPNKQQIGEYELQTAVYSDTTFTYLARILDFGATSFHIIQTALLDTKQLYADSIHVVFDSLLVANNIHAQSIIGITASFYTKLDDWSGDTTALDINFRTIFSNQGRFEDINYYACLHYDCSTLWKLMPKKRVCILLLCNLIIGALWVGWWRKRRIEKTNGIRILKNGNYQIKDIIFDVEKKTLVSDEREIKLAAQPNELFLMFLQAEDHKVSKVDIKQRFWPKNLDPVSNMTSAINRLKMELKEIGCSYTVYSDPEDENFYIFVQHSARDNI